MHARLLKSLVFVCFLTIGLTTVGAASVELHSVQFPEKTLIDMSFLPTSAAPTARVTADITYRRGQAKIDLAYTDMKPAILFGGDVTCYVLWAITRDGQIENLGELLTRKSNGRLSFSTGKKAFALLVTAESYYLVGKPSELVVFRSRPSAIASAPSSSFEFTEFVAAPRHGMEAIAHIKWDSDVPLELLQARKAFELATKQDAEAHTPEIYADAESALIKSNEIAMDAPRSRQLLDVARRAVTLSNEALNISTHRIEAIALEEDNARRRAETEALEQRAAEAEVTAREAAELAERARADAERTRIEKERMVAETAALESEKGELESTMTLLREERLGLIAESERLHQEKVDLEMESERLLREKSELHARLESALSHVAETQESAHGFVVNLPDILFDLNEATLKTEAQLVLAKLAGIMLIMPDQGAVIEGHTDSTGSPDYNLDLSQRRARAVLDFMQGEGLAPTRLRAIGKGMESPVADNSSPEGRKRNRRVEIEITAEDVDHLASN